MQGEEPTRQAADHRTLTVRRWSVEEWLSNEVAWNDLVARSATDALFLSWEWLTKWCTCFAAVWAVCLRSWLFTKARISLASLAVLPAPRARWLRAHPFRAVSWAVLARRSPADLRVPGRDRRGADLERVREACVRFLCARQAGLNSWPALHRRGPLARAHTRCAAPRVHYVRELTARFPTRRTSSGFPAYRAICISRRAAASGTCGAVCTSAAPCALKSCPQRTSRAASGILIVCTICAGKACVRRPAPAVSYHAGAAAGGERGELALSRLWVGGQVVSVLYDVRKGTRQYNIKMAFDPGFNPQVSLGLLHLGYAIEAAAERRIGCYDFLAGPGRSSDFKRLLSQQRLDLSCVQMLRGALLTSLYRWGDRVRQR